LDDKLQTAARAVLTTTKGLSRKTGKQKTVTKATSKKQQTMSKRTTNE